MHRIRLTRPVIKHAVILAKRRQDRFRELGRHPFPVLTPSGTTANLPLAQALARVRRHWRRWLAFEVIVGLALGPFASTIAPLPLLYIVSAWLTEAALASGIDHTMPLGADDIALVLSPQLAQVWHGRTPKSGRGYRLLAVGFGLEWAWADWVVQQSLRTLLGQSEAAALKMSSAMSSTDSIPTAIRTVPSVMPMACRASSVCDRCDAMRGYSANV